MKVAYIVSMFPCWSETFILRELVGVHRQGIETLVCSLKPCTETLVQPEAAAFVEQGKVFYPSPVRGVARFAWCLVRHPFRVAGFLMSFLEHFHGPAVSLMRSLASVILAADFMPILREQGVQHIHACWGTYPSTAALFLARVSGYPISFTTHAHDLFLEDHALAVKFQDARFAVTISEYNRNLIARRYPDVTLEKVHVVHSALDTAFYSCERQPVTPPLLVSVGRLVEMKGLADLIDACALLRERCLPFRCRIVGDGPLKQDLKGRIERHGLVAQVELHDPVPQDEIRKLLSQAACFVLPCVTATDGDQDGIPTVLIEAMAAGVPVISCPTSGVPELVESGVTGLLAESRNPQSLAQAIERLLSDRDLRERLVAAAHVKIHEDYNIVKTAACLAGLFRKRARIPSKVLLIIDELEIGGAQRQVRELVKGLLAAGLSVHVIYFRPESAEMLPDFHAAGIRPIVVPKHRRVDFLFLYRLWRTIVHLQPEIVQTYSPTADLWGRAAAVLARSPVIISVARSVQMTWTMKLLDPFTSTFISNSQAVKDSLQQNRGIPADRVTVVPNGMDLSLYGNWNRTGNAVPMIGVACRLVPVKNLSCLLHAAARLKKAGVRYLVVIAGDGPLEKVLKEEAQELGVQEDVAFLGSRTDVPQLLSGWDVAVLPSWHEGMPNFLMEAMAACLPIVASDVPANRELLKGGEVGVLFPPESPQALADALLDLLKDPQRAQALGERAGHAIQGYTVEAMVRRHLELYEQTYQRITCDAKA